MALTLIQSKNFLVNGNFSVWQSGTSITGIANGSSTYGPDQWYAKNSLGTNGVLRLDQQAPATAGSVWGCQIKISTAPTAAQTNGCELYQTLENLDSLELYNQTASLSIQVKALTNVNQIGVQFYYKTTEAKVDTAIGSEQLFTVNSSTFTSCFIAGQALGTSQTTSGVIGVRIRITGVSTGNTYDINNGFIVEQGILNLGVNPALFADNGIQGEIERCQRFFWRTPANAALPGGGQFNTTTAVKLAVAFPVRMRTAPTPSVSAGSDLVIDRPGTSSASGTGTPSYANTTTDSTYMSVTSGSASTQGFATTLVFQNNGYFQADARI